LSKRFGHLPDDSPDADALLSGGKAPGAVIQAIRSKQEMKHYHRPNKANISSHQFRSQFLSSNAVLRTATLTGAAEDADVPSLTSCSGFAGIIPY